MPFLPLLPVTLLLVPLLLVPVFLPVPFLPDTQFAQLECMHKYVHSSGLLHILNEPVYNYTEYECENLKQLIE